MKRSSNTNAWDVLVALLVLLCSSFLGGGTAYLVQVHNWSPWTFLLTLAFTPSTKTWFSVTDEGVAQEKLEILTEAAKNLRDKMGKPYETIQACDKAINEAAEELDDVLESVV